MQFNCYFAACGDCWGAEGDSGQCCDTCQEVRDAYKTKQWRFFPSKITQCVNEAVNTTIGTGISYIIRRVILILVGVWRIYFNSYFSYNF